MGSGASDAKYALPPAVEPGKDSSSSRPGLVRKTSVSSASGENSLTLGAELQATDDKAKWQEIITQRTGTLTDHYEVKGEIAPFILRVINNETAEQHAARCINKERRSAEDINNEVQILQRVDHPNIANLFEVFQDDANVYLVIELSSYSLAAVLDEEILCEEAAANVMKQTMRALMYMHDQHICFRDLNPEAIMLVSCSKGLTTCKVHLVDLHAACQFHRSKPMKGRAGTPAFSSPQMMQKEPYTISCDVWSAGIILYEMLAGHDPFDGDLLQHLKDSGKEENEWPKVTAEKLAKMAKEDLQGLSKTVQKMLKKMLEYQEKSRWTLEECVRWCWFDENGFGAPKLALTVNEVESMNAFASMPKLQKISMHIIARRVPDEVTDRLKEVFDSIDLDCNGVVTLNELHVAIKKFQQTQGEKWRAKKALGEEIDTRALMNALDTSGNFSLEFTEFVAATLPRKYYQSQNMLKAAFMALDADGSGSISLQELQSVMLDDRRSMSEEERKSIQKTLQDADIDGDGEVSFEEFVELMKSTADDNEEEQHEAPQDATESPSRGMSSFSLEGFFGGSARSRESSKQSRRSSKASTSASSKSPSKASEAAKVRGNSKESSRGTSSPTVKRRVSTSGRTPSRIPSINSSSSFGRFFG